MPATSFLFWNINRRPLADRVGRLLQAHSPDIVILAECETASATVSRALNAAGPGGFHVVPNSGELLRVFTRLPIKGWTILLRETLDAWFAFRVAAPPIPELLVFVAHLPSKLQTEPEDRLLTASLLAGDLARLEQQEGHTRTLLIGDLNANPFEPPVAGAGGLHGVMTRDIARRERREIRAREYPMLYNPMWGAFGDRNPGPPGTYYRASSQSVNYFWNVYDQVLLRPVLMDHLTELRILDSDGTESLLTPAGLPDTATASDHLPLLFRLEW